LKRLVRKQDERLLRVTELCDDIVPASTLSRDVSGMVDAHFPYGCFSKERESTNSQVTNDVRGGGLVRRSELTSIPGAEDAYDARLEGYESVG